MGEGGKGKEIRNALPCQERVQRVKNSAGSEALAMKAVHSWS